MLKPTIKFAILFALLWIMIKMLFFMFNIFPNNIVPTALLNNLFLLLSISLGLYMAKKKEGFGIGTAFSDLKKAIAAGMIYTVIIAGFIYFFYDTINPEFTQHRIEERMDLLYSEMERPSYRDSLRTQNMAFETMTDDEILNKIKTDTINNLSPKNSFVFSLLGMLVLTVTYALFITIIYQRILLKDYYRNEKK